MCVRFFSKNAAKKIGVFATRSETLNCQLISAAGHIE